MFFWLFGSMYPAFSSVENSTMQLNPCVLAKIFASMGIVSSVRYSSSPATSTTVLPCPAPPGVAAISRYSCAEVKDATRARVRIRIFMVGMTGGKLIPHETAKPDKKIQTRSILFPTTERPQAELTTSATNNSPLLTLGAPAKPIKTTSPALQFRRHEAHGPKGQTRPSLR